VAVQLKIKEITIAVSGTAVPLFTSVEIDRIQPQVLVQSLTTNNGTVYVGESSVLASSANGMSLAPNENVELAPPDLFGTGEELDLSKTFVDSSVSGDKVIVAYITRIQG